MQPTPDRVPIVAVVGATASGKTNLSLDLAARLGGEIETTTHDVELADELADEGQE